MKKINRYAQGFSLVELMVVVAILGILMVIVLPSYSDYVIKSRRVDAQRALVEYAQSLERYYTANGSYVCGGAPANVPQLYAITCVVAGNVATITATPSGAQSSDGALSLTTTGARTPPGKWSN